jgi:hypothetical protein
VMTVRNSDHPIRSSGCTGMLTRARWIMTLPLAILASACDGGVIGEGFILGVVYGSITDASGSPVAGVRVTLRDLDRTTCSQPLEFPHDSTLSAASGIYRVEAATFGGARRDFSYPVCAQLEVRFPAGLAHRDTTLARIDYRMYFGTRDSTRIDIHLPE